MADFMGAMIAGELLDKGFECPGCEVGWSLELKRECRPMAEVSNFGAD